MSPKSKRKNSQRQEKEIAEIFEGKLVLASGSLWFAKGDVRTKDFLIECKTTKEDNYRLRYSIWDKISGEALKDNLREPLMLIELENSNTLVVFKTFNDLQNLVDIKEKTCETTSFLIKDEDSLVRVNWISKKDSIFIAPLSLWLDLRRKEWL